MRPIPVNATEMALANKSGAIPSTAGVGLKPQHFKIIIESKPDVGWFEIHPENYFIEGGPMLQNLQKIRELYPLSFHSVGMSLGSVNSGQETKEFKELHLQKLKRLSERFEPALISDHLSWSSWNQTALNDLLPMPYTLSALEAMAENVDRAQTILGTSIGIENPSSYLNFKPESVDDESLDECEFLIRLVEMTGASILLDVNNVYVSAKNHGWDAKDYISRIPAELITEIHLAGHTVQKSIVGDVLIDDHGSKVCEGVWDLYQFTLELSGKKPSLIEWDTDVPEWSVLQAEANKAGVFLSWEEEKSLQAIVKKKVRV